MIVPTLQSERLILDGWKKADFPAYAAFWADPDRTQFFISGVLDKAGAWGFFAGLVGEWQLSGRGCFAIRRKGDSAAVGVVGLWCPPDIKEPELMWSLFAGNEGQGFATEAARTVQVWARDDLGLPPLMSFVHPDNKPSIAVAERLGASLEGETLLRGYPRLIYRHVFPKAAR